MNQALLFALLPFFALLLLAGLVLYYARRGRPIQIKLAGLGISFELKGESVAPRLTKDR